MSINSLCLGHTTMTKITLKQRSGGMQKTTTISADRRNGNLHVKIVGEYTETVLHDLMTCLATQNTGSGNIFIHTTQITQIRECRSSITQQLMTEAQLCRDNIYLIGKNGLELNIPCNKIIIPPPKKTRCSGCKKKVVQKNVFHEV